MAHYVKPELFDAVTGFDFIEHFTKDRSIEMMRLSESLSRKVVMFFTPYGMYEVVHDQPLHTHLCGWLPEDFVAQDYC